MKYRALTIKPEKYQPRWKTEKPIFEVLKERMAQTDFTACPEIHSQIVKDFDRPFHPYKAVEELVERESYLGRFVNFITP